LCFPCCCMWLADWNASNQHSASLCAVIGNRQLASV